MTANKPPDRGGCRGTRHGSRSPRTHGDRGDVQPGSLPEPPLRCIECGTISEGDADGWRAYVAFVEEDGEPPEVGIYCPVCAKLEFGE